jgi:hypothetical protein
LVYKVDRLTRALADFARMVELFDNQSVSFVAVTQQFNTTKLAMIVAVVATAIASSWYVPAFVMDRDLFAVQLVQENAGHLLSIMARWHRRGSASLLLSVDASARSGAPIDTVFSGGGRDGAD